MADPNIDIVIDCADPETLAEFWAEALGYTKAGMFAPYFVLLAPTREYPPVILASSSRRATITTPAATDATASTEAAAANGGLRTRSGSGRTDPAGSPAIARISRTP